MRPNYSTLKSGDIIEVDTDGFGPCLPKGERKMVFFCEKEGDFYVLCADGKHYLGENLDARGFVWGFDQVIE